MSEIKHRARPGPHTAIVVGSGCSVGLGVPVMAGFLDTVMDKLEKKGFYPKAKEDLNCIQDFITRVKGAAAYVKADMLNIEELYGMADMDEDLWKAANNPSGAWHGCKPIEVKKALNRAIFHLASPAGDEFLSNKAHFPKDMQELIDVKRESATEMPLHRNLGTRWTNLLAYLCLASFEDRSGTHPLFIQFNWDLALDRALCLWSKLDGKPEFESSDVNKLWLPWYGDERTGELNYEEWPRLARPHGGINWINNEPALGAPPIDDVPLKSRCFRLYPRERNNDVWVDTCPVHSDPKILAESEWEDGEYMDIVPPTWRKQATKPVYEAQWGHISQGLANVRRIIFVGYSLPKTDLYFRHFLALSLANNPHLPKVYVLNPSILDSDGVRDNFIDLFAPLAREGRLFGIPGRFGDPALFDLHRAMALAKPIRLNEGA